MTDTSGLRFSKGDEITPLRGKGKGKTATVIDANASDQTYAVRFADGTFSVVNAVNVKTPEEPAITASQLAEAFGAYANELNEVTITALERAVPGITDRFVISHVQA